MNKLLFVLMFPLMLLGCKKDDPKPEPEIANLVDKWKLVAHEKTVDGEEIWVPIDGEPQFMIFRYDGLILDAKGLPACCGPRAYYVNGVLFEVKPKEPVPVNERCSLIDCMSCPSWDFEVTGNELIVTVCAPNSTRSKYVRE